MAYIFSFIIFGTMVCFLSWLRTLFRYKKNKYSYVLQKRYDEFLESHLGQEYEKLDYDEDYEKMIISVMVIDDEEVRDKILEILVEDRNSNKKNRSKAIS